MGPGRSKEKCNRCGEDLYRVNDVYVCPHCAKREAVGAGAVPIVPGSAGTEALAKTLIERQRVVRHEDEVLLVTAAGTLVPLAGAGAERLLAGMVEVVDGLGVRRLLKPAEAGALASWLNEHFAELPELKVNVPRSVLIRTADDRFEASSAGLRGGVLTREYVEPENTGEWARFLDMTPFADAESRRVYEAVTMTAVLPLEVGLYPLVVISANTQSAGKSWAVRLLTWALGYPGGHAIDISLNPTHPLRRQVVSGLLAGRVLELDNRTGDKSAVLSNNDLSELLTSPTIQVPAMYRYGMTAVQNRGILCMTLNAGRLGEDLATRAVGVQLEYDPDDPRVADRGRLGELYWQRADVSRRVLAEILWRARERLNATIGWSETDSARPQQWRSLAWRLTGARIPPLDVGMREFADIEPEALRAVLGSTGKTSAELAETLRRSGRGAVAEWARSGPSVLGAKLAEYARTKEGAWLGRRREHVGAPIWYVKS